ncbi:MAG: hypothetical protein B6I38_09830 [Anaerolineaceae bacterium 4572_5.1]|nr:MAG: hypothetical protein B6I38_09830 [Anaerolineaceae bacterium 4572_5.1]
MAKKRKRQVTKRSASASVSARRAAAEFNPDYSDIKKDLKNIGILAGSALLVLIILSFFL